MKKEMSIKNQMFWGKIFVGILWIGTGILGMVDTLPCNIVQMVCLLGGVVILTVLLKSKLEKDDEMSEHNYVKAQAKTNRIMHYVFCIAMIATPLIYKLMQDIDVSWVRVVSQMFFILMGIQDISTGLVFRRLEAE